MSSLPPIARLSASRGTAAGRRLAAALALMAGLAFGGCDMPRDESLAGLAIASPGSISLTNAAGEPVPLDGAPVDVRHVSAASGRIAVMTADTELLIADPAPKGESRIWRPLTFEASSGRTPSGMDLSPDGTAIAIVLGDPETPGLELVTMDVATGSDDVQAVDLMANGPPAWLSPEIVLLEVIRPDQQSGTATLDRTTGAITVTDAQGFGPSPTRDASHVAMVGTAGIVIAEAAGWLAGDPIAAPALAPPVDSSVLDVALDADGTRLAVVYAASSGAAASVVILRRSGAAWESATTVPVPGDVVVSIDWLD